MNCDEQYSKLIHKYLDGDATAKEKQQLDRHIATCPECAEHMWELKKAIAFVQSASHIELLSDLPIKSWQICQNGNRHQSGRYG